MAKGRRSKKLVACIDVGTSLSKIIYRIGGGSVRHLTMEAEILKLPATSAATLPRTAELGKPEDSAWVRLSEGGDCYVVGRLAREYRATVSIKRLKYESVVPKILAGVGAIAASERLSSEIELQLGLLLPFGEYANAREIEAELLEAARGFEFQGTGYQVQLKDYCCYPEGYGMALSNVRHHSLEQFQRQTRAYLMFGYRNTSLLLFRQGTLSRSESSTTQLGFYDLIDKICRKVSGLSREEVQHSIRTADDWFYNPAKANRDRRSVTCIEVGDLVKSSDSTKAAKEREEIEAAVDVAMAEYWQLLCHWLDEVLPPVSQLEAVVYGGGTSEFLKEKLEGYLGSRKRDLKLSSSAVEEAELMAALVLDEYELRLFQGQNLALRLADVWGLFVNFAGYEPEMQEAT